VKFALLVSVTAGNVILVILISTVAPAGPATNQACVPSLGVEAMIVVQVVPPSRDISIFTLPVLRTPIDVHVML
jgi:hypothetical protein